VSVTPRPPIRFGLYIGLANKPLSQLYDEAEMAEALGFDHCWLSDHLLPPAGPTEGLCHEAWMTLAGIAARTRRLKLGVLVSSNTFRHPAVLLKQAVTLDHASDGRLILGIGTGWHEEEHRRYGIDLPAAAARVDRFEEALEVITRLMAGGRASFDGRYYRLDEAPLVPPPVQQRIPLLIAAHRPRMLRLAAKYADMWDTYPTIPESANDGVRTDVAERVEAFETACLDTGRDPDAVRRSIWATRAGLTSERAYLDFVQGNLRLGFTDFTTVMPAPENAAVLDRVAREIIPELRESAATESTAV
jgi:alkanesulfonate monooxygenase SsuD/methylene tetrahydromethanopterin reductase-like flavin-dependent oxidoreductase (luciferase family)